VIIKAEVVRLPGRNPTCHPRFVVTNLRETSATVYARSCQRGDVENRLKELHDGLALGRTSYSQFWANLFRVLLKLRLMCCSKNCGGRLRAQPARTSTLRERLLKLAVWVERSVLRVVLHMPQFAPWSDTWRRVAVAVGARAG